jgi:hypothetical protein
MVRDKKQQPRKVEAATPGRPKSKPAAPVMSIPVSFEDATVAANAAAVLRYFRIKHQGT